MALSTVAIFLIVAGSVLVVAILIAGLLLVLHRRRGKKRASVMITMTGTTVVADNGARKFQEAAWVTNKIPFPSVEYLEEEAISRRQSMRTPVFIGTGIEGLREGSSSGGYSPPSLPIEDTDGTAVPDLEAGVAPALTRPNNNVRASYTSAKRLHIPSVLPEHLNEEDEDTSSDEAIRTGSSGGNTSISSGSNEKNTTTIYIEGSQNGGPAFANDAEIQKLFGGGGKGVVSTATELGGKNAVVVVT